MSTLEQYSAADHVFMAKALSLANLGLYTTTPNPRVGCVITRANEIVGEGYHVSPGGPHAEIIALQQAGNLAQGATVYVTLEPCAHYGRTPPCGEALIRAGVTRVVAAMQDPNPLVSGKGFAGLRDAGITVHAGLMEAAARALNPGFIKRMETGLPWLRLKIAASLDGRTALQNGRSLWITDEPARRDGHRWRARSCAVLTGINTILNDDPALTVRAVDVSRAPIRVVVDTQLRIPLTAKILNHGKVLILTGREDTGGALQAKYAQLQNLGAEVVTIPVIDDRLNLLEAMKELAGRGMNEVLVEAGATLNGALMQADLVDEIIFYLAPTLLGNDARAMFQWPAITDMAARRDLEFIDIRKVGRDLRIIARPKKCSPA